MDIFPPAVDDAYEYGQIAAANSLSDVWAMGGEARLCMNILMFPEHLPFDTVQAILRGGYDKAAEAEAIVVGGHTIKDDIPKYGLCMATLNKYAADAVRSLDGVHACTDVTGFSLLGHSYEMCGESGLTVIIDSSRVPLLPGADNYASMGLVPAVAYQNMKHLKDKVALPKDLPSHVHDLLFDPQTSGGLLYSVASQEAGRIMEALLKACQSPAVIGHVDGPSAHPVMVI